MRELSTCVCIVMLTATAGLSANGFPPAGYQQLFSDGNEGTQGAPDTCAGCFF